MIEEAQLWPSRASARHPVCFVESDLSIIHLVRSESFVLMSRIVQSIWLIRILEKLVPNKFSHLHTRNPLRPALRRRDKIALDSTPVGKIFWMMRILSTEKASVKVGSFEMACIKSVHVTYSCLVFKVCWLLRRQKDHVREPSVVFAPRCPINLGESTSYVQELPSRSLTCRSERLIPSYFSQLTLINRKADIDRDILDSPQVSRATVSNYLRH